jgi:phosphoserine phosphatase
LLSFARDTPALPRTRGSLAALLLLVSAAEPLFSAVVSLFQPSMNRKQGKDAALSAVKGAAPGTVLLVDFDHTLLLANSSEEFVRSARPYLLAAVVLKLLEYLKPWNLLGTPEARRIARETLRVRIICLLFPFALAGWRGRAGKIAEKWGNSQLLKALRQRADCRVVITSLGFKSLLAPVLRHMSLPEGWSLDAGDIWVGASERHRSKWDRLRDRHDAAALQAAVLITDSGDDLDLVERVDNSHVVNWPEGERAQVFNHYMPFQYLVKVKHGDWNYPRSVILGDEFVQLVLCLSWLSVFPLVHSFAISLLLLSFWMIYELGYMENDLIAEESEVEPVLGPNFAAGRSMIALREPWV